MSKKQEKTSVPKTWWKTSRYSWYTTPVVVVSETSSSVWVDKGNGLYRRENKHSSYADYWPRPEDALKHLKEMAIIRIKALEEELAEVKKSSGGGNTSRMSEHATVKLGEYTVPLIGVPKDATEERCEGCGRLVHVSNIAFDEEMVQRCIDCKGQADTGTGRPARIHIWRVPRYACFQTQGAGGRLSV